VQPGVTFHGRLSRSDRRPANPGQYQLLFQLYTSDRSRRVLWSEVHDDVAVRSGGFYDVVLGAQAPMSASLFADTPRWLAVQILRKGVPAGEVDPRVPILGEALRLSARLDHIEGALAGGDDEEERGARLAALPARIQRIYTGLRRLSEQVAGLEDASALREILQAVQALDARVVEAEQRVLSVEDELGDIVGPGGDVVDLNQRMDRLEGAGAGGGGGQGTSTQLAALKALIDQMRARQDQTDALVAGLIARMGTAGLVTAAFPASALPLEGAVVAVEGEQLVPASAEHAAVVGVALGARGGQRVTVAVGGVVEGRVFGPIQAGALLTVSEVAGHAVTREDEQGVVVGRALGSNPGGHGRIRIRLL